MYAPNDAEAVVVLAGLMTENIPGSEEVISDWERREQVGESTHP